MDKHSSLLQKFVNFGRKKFFNIGPIRHVVGSGKVLHSFWLQYHFREMIKYATMILTLKCWTSLKNLQMCNTTAYFGMAGFGQIRPS